MKVGIFGSAFNPPTNGHWDAINQCIEHVDEVWLVPSFNHAFGKRMSAYSKRCELVDAFAYDLQSQSVSVKAVCCEHEIGNEGFVSSYDLLQFLSNKHPEHEFALMIGEDNSDNFSAFHKSEEIIKKWSILVSKDNVPIRSTLVRGLRTSRKNIDDLVTPSVLKAISQTNIDKEWY